MAYVEIEAYIIANLVAGMEAGILDPAPIWTDAKTFDARPFRGRVHGIIGGYPCPGESLAGLREGHLYKGFIWPYIRRAFATTRPLWGFFENVDDHLTGTFPIVQRSLQNMGYRVEAGVYSAEEVGAPHERQRIFILAVANSYRQGYGTGTGQAIAKGSKTKGEAQRKEWNDLLRQWMWDVVGNSGQELGNTKRSAWGPIAKGDVVDRENTRRKETASGFELAGEESLADEVGQRLEIRREQSAWEKQPTIERGGYTQFPARPGKQQYDWEEPRTIKSGLGCTIDGYNFREDLLRALGNSVVEQTAELAFIDLLKKHLRNVEK
jgi:DNA (cytosine-5)-methyltransferase 1